MTRTSGPPDPVLAAVVRRLRQESGRTQEAVAARTGITLSCLQKVELGRTDPNWLTVRKIAQGLNVSLRELLSAVEVEKDAGESSPASAA